MRKTIERIIEYASRISDAEQIILFGSMANATNDVYSDLDLLIVSEDIFSKKQTIEKIKQFASEFSVSADVLVYSRRQIEKESEQSFSFISGIIKSGKIVYQNNKKTL